MLPQITFARLRWIVAAQFGLDPGKFIRACTRIFSYLRDWKNFRNGYEGTMTIFPCLHDRDEESGVTMQEYFWQDLVVARWIYEARPEKHVDIGSRVDGFVAHVASFRDVEVFDVRPNSAEVPGVFFRQVDFMNPNASEVLGENYCDSLSCLHAVEHFGLGRYGDQIDPYGYERGIANMTRLLKPGGRLYLSTPIGQERVEFNAHRVFDPRTIVKCAMTHGLVLKKIEIVLPKVGVREMGLSDDVLFELAQRPYCLGIFVFSKKRHIT